jgi:hypothetical protein
MEGKNGCVALEIEFYEAVQGYTAGDVVSDIQSSEADRTEDQECVGDMI